MTEKQIKNRIGWCNKYSNFDWDNVKFSDEASFWLEFTGRRWVSIDENDYDFKVKYPVKIHVWGVISKKFERRIFVFTENLNAIGYLNILKNNLGVDDNDFIFQDDNDPKHRSKLIKKWKADNNITSLDWPSNSPDLNPIENIWGVMKKKIRKYKHKTIAEFKSNIVKCWNEIKQEHINNIIDSMPKRIKLVLDNKGGSIKY